MRPRGTLSVLTYHRIGDPADGPPGIVSATPAVFDAQMRWLAASGRAVSMSDLLRAREGSEPLRPGAVHVTFDDGYRDFARRAWPILRRHGIPVTLFVVTEMTEVGGVFWWERLWAAVRDARNELATPIGRFALQYTEDRLRAYRAVRDHVKALPHDEAMALVDELIAALDPPPLPSCVLTWPELRRLAAEGVTVAAHSRTHPLLNRVEDERAREEIAGSVEDVRRMLGEAAAPAFAFPGGRLPAGAQTLLQEAGILVSFTTERGTNSARRPDWLHLRRINVGRRTGLPTLRMQATRSVVWRASRPRPPAIARGRVGGASPAAPAAGANPRVAYVMSRFPKLSETFIFSEILALERRDVSVDIYPLLRERQALTHPEVAPLVARANFMPFLSPAIVASQLHWLARRPGAYLGALRDVLRGTWGNANFFLGALATFPKVAHAARMMQSAGVRHVHCHFATHPAVAGFVIRRLTGIPFSFTAHGSDLHRDRTMLAQKVAESEFVATVSHYNRRLILEECGERWADKVHVVRAGVDTSMFAPHSQAAVRPDRAFKVVCVGTLHEVKGQQYLIEACRLLADAGVEVSCRLIGGGPDRAALQRRIVAAGLQGRVVLAGAHTREQIAQELQGADVLAAPSVATRDGRREGIPVVLMEAMSSGLAVVASAISGIPELVEDGVSGLLVPPGDAEAIAAGLRRLHDDPRLRRDLGAAARERVRAEFDLERSAAELARRFGMEAAA